MGQVDDKQNQRLVLAHYMPWYMAKPYSQVWGWHWTMNTFDPTGEKGGKPKLASHFTPLIGPYDSGDPAVLEYHLLTMKGAGIDGVIVDWYGLEDFRDYAFLHHNTVKLVEMIDKLGMKFAICYEDQTIPALVEGKKIAENQRVSHAVGDLEWMAEHWFSKRSYVAFDGKPVLLSFGQAGLTDQEWTETFKSLKKPINYFSLHLRRTSAIGAFDWPIPSQGMKAHERFLKEAKGWKSSIPVVCPRFVDIYEEAKVSKSYGRMEDEDGKAFRRMLESAFATKSPIVQLATWNDWGEGTIIEPSIEFGYRDLEVVQEFHRKSKKLSANADDLKLAHQLYLQRKAGNDSFPSADLDRISNLLRDGEYREARQLLKTQ